MIRADHFRGFIFFSLIIILATTANAQFDARRPGRDIIVPKQESTKPDTWKPLPSAAVGGTVNVKLVWSRALGLPPTYPGSTETTPMPCGSFVFAINNQRERIKSSIGRDIETERVEGVERYVCNYTLEGLPKEQQLSVTGVFIDLRVWETQPWISIYSVEGVGPGPGQIRVLNGGRRFVLTDAEPVVNVEFQVQYETPRRPIKIF